MSDTSNSGRGLRGAPERAIAERLHDGPLQVLVTMQMKLGPLERHCDAYGRVVPQEIAELRRLTDSAVEDLTRILREVWNEELPAPRDECDSTLMTRLAELCEDFRLEAGVKCRFAVRAEHVCFDAVVSDVLCRGVRELLRNAQKYARASLVQVTSETRDPASVVIRVEDDGVGLRGRDWRTAPLQSDGFGLWSIDQRLRQLGGHLEVESGAGTRAALVLPREHTVSD